MVFSSNVPQKLLSKICFSFSSLVSHDVIISTNLNSFKSGWIAKSYLFSKTDDLIFHDDRLDLLIFLYFNNSLIYIYTYQRLLTVYSKQTTNYVAKLLDGKTNSRKHDIYRLTRHDITMHNSLNSMHDTLSFESQVVYFYMVM